MYKIKNVPNNDEGKTFIKTLRKYLKDTPTRVVLRGRGPRQGKFYRDLPIVHAQRFTVYFEPKPTYRFKKVLTTQVVKVEVERTVPKVEYVRVPTKWAPKVSV